MTGRISAELLLAADRLGVISNVWAEALKNGERFEDLAGRFGGNGFTHLEIRDGEYLRSSHLGSLLERIEAAMGRYSDGEWKEICRDPALNNQQGGLEKEIHSFLGALAGLEVSYAISHPWLTAPLDEGSDNNRVVTAIKLAFLLNPARARVRLVAPPQDEYFEFQVAAANLKRYRSLLPDYPLTYAVENGIGVSAVRTYEAALAGGFKFAYDEANYFREDGTPLHDPEEFRRVASRESLASIHLKQKSRAGTLPRLTEGYVDFKEIFRWAGELGYEGDWLLEPAPTADPLADALRSRSYLSENL